MLALSEVDEAIAYEIELFSFHKILKLLFFDSRNYTLNPAITCHHRMTQNIAFMFRKICHKTVIFTP